MTKFIIRRLLLGIIIVFCGAFVVYAVLRCLPTSYVESIARQRSALPGITQDRAMTIVGAGIIAVEIMRALGINEIEVCPWALREGAILRWLDQYGRTRFGF